MSVPIEPAAPALTIQDLVLAALRNHRIASFGLMRRRVRSAGFTTEELARALCQLCFQAAVEPATTKGFRLSRLRDAPTNSPRAALLNAEHLYLLASGWKRAVRRRHHPLTGREESWCHPTRRSQPTNTENALIIQKAFDNA